MKSNIILSLLLLSANLLYSQAYMTSAGLRAGTDWGISLQQRISKSATLEGIVQSSLQREEFMVTFLAEQHYPVLFRGLNLYFGAGLHKGWLQKTSSNEIVIRSQENPLGISLVGGAELTIGKLNISYDFKPAVNVTGGEKIFYPQTGISVRYVILDNKVFKDLVKQRDKKERAEKRKSNRSQDNWKFWKKDKK
jgi:hypothetical protein